MTVGSELVISSMELTQADKNSYSREFVEFPQMGLGEFVTLVGF